LFEAYQLSLFIEETGGASISMADMNNDGRPDIIMSGIYLNEGGGKYVPHQTADVSPLPKL
jgi:hypothetical protein